MGQAMDKLIPDTDPDPCEDSLKNAKGEEKQKLYENLLQQAARDGDLEELRNYLDEKWLADNGFADDEIPHPDSVDIQFGQAALANAAEGALEDEDPNADPPILFTECVKLLLANEKVNVNKKDAELETALMSACIAGNVNTVGVLIEATLTYDREHDETKNFKPYTHLDDRDDDGRTALIYASKNLNPECIELLIAAGADVMIKSFLGRLASDYVRKHAEGGVRREKCLKLLTDEEERIRLEEERLKFEGNEHHAEMAKKLTLMQTQVNDSKQASEAAENALAQKSAELEAATNEITRLQELLRNSQEAPADPGPMEDSKAM